jgi:hypothetical protein
VYDAQKAEATEDLEGVASVAVHVQLGSIRGDQCFSEVEQSHATDRAFFGFRIKLNNFLNVALPREGIPLPNGTRVSFQAGDKVC